ncbi:MAG: hypothetical protein KIT31_39245 [Deltaproteobacteria bacterium]|nr:hypothetical protein [Deltaproteobacteria bacterium]
MYVASGAGSAASCSQSDPCSLPTAISRAVVSTPQPLVRMLPGAYNAQLNLESVTNEPLRVVATGATMVATVGAGGPITVVKGGRLEFRSGALLGGMFCGTPSSPRSRLALRDVSIQQTGWNGVNCDFEILRADITLTGSITTGDDFTLVFDRVRMRAVARSSLIQMNGQRGKVRVTNSILEDMNFSAECSSACNNSFEMAFSTVVLDQALDAQLLGCADTNAVPGTWSASYENNIFASIGPPPPLGGNVFRGKSVNCTLRNNIMFPQPTPIAGNPAVDPQFVNVAGRDYHLMPASPARDAAVPSSANLGTDHDLEGTARPQGPRSDLGAYELAP